MVGKKHAGIPIHIFMVILCVLCIVPFMLLIASSLTDEVELAANGYRLIPAKFSTAAYSYIFSGAAGKIVRGYVVSIVVTAIGTTVSLIISTLFAYPLSRDDLPGRGILMIFLFITMLFNGGLVPSYMMWTQMFHIKNTFFALILPNLLMNAFSVIMMRTYFVTSIPRELIEAARIDGASELTLLGRVVLPLSKPIIATLGFMTALGYWNDWMNGLYYVTDTNYFGIQNILNRMLTDAQFLASSEGAKFTQMSNIQVPSVGIRMAVAVIGILPMLAAYPFFQKHLVKGITLGGVKG